MERSDTFDRGAMFLGNCEGERRRVEARFKVHSLRLSLRPPISMMRKTNIGVFCSTYTIAAMY